MRVVDPERLRAIPESLRTEWHANGWLAALEAHVAPARHWETLLAGIVADPERRLSAGLISSGKPGRHREANRYPALLDRIAAEIPRVV